MKNKFLIILILFVASCCKEDFPTYQVDGEGVVVSMKYKWKSQLHSSNNSSYGFIDTLIIYGSKILVFMSDSQGKGNFTLIDVITGKPSWSWNDVFTNSPGGDFCIYNVFKNNDLLTWQSGSRSYCINLSNGSTHWKIQREFTFHDKINGFNYCYFTLGLTNLYPGFEILIGYKGNVENGIIEEFLIPNFSFNHSISVRCCDVTEIIPYVLNGVQHLAVVYQELTSSEVWYFQSYLGLFNLETSEWVYDRKIMNEPNLNGVSLATPVIFNGKFYANIGKELVCHDLTSGDRVWKRNFDQDFMFSGFIIEDGMLLANCEDTYLYRINPENGNVEWQTKSAGTSGRMSYLNGVVYYVGGSTGYLHAVDTESGLKTVWRIDARRLGESDGSFTTNAVYCIPGEGGEKGKVIALSGRYAYCFDAYR